MDHGPVVVRAVGLVGVLLDARLARFDPSLVVLYHGKGPLRGWVYVSLRFQRVRERWKRSR